MLSSPAQQNAQAFLVEQGLATAEEAPVWTPLTGGVSSELWRVDLAGGSICVKGALAKLLVDGDWHAPLSRNGVEWDWLTFGHRVAAGSVPVPLRRDERRGLFAMSYLPSDRHSVWKSSLLDGEVDRAVAAAVGDLVGRLHAASATDPDVPSRFATDENFHLLRIEPYLLTTAGRHPDLAADLRALAERTACTHRALVHGDVSPKNILIGPDGPVLIDAECAWFGDPAFDLAFVLTHLVLKAVVRPEKAPELADAAAALTQAYESRVDWEPADHVSRRAAQLLPALLLARVDGKSPVEYLDTPGKEQVRRVARLQLQESTGELAEVLAASYRGSRRRTS